MTATETFFTTSTKSEAASSFHGDSFDGYSRTRLPNASLASTSYHSQWTCYTSRCGGTLHKYTGPVNNLERDKRCLLSFCPFIQSSFMLHRVSAYCYPSSPRLALFRLTPLIFTSPLATVAPYVSRVKVISFLNHDGPNTSLLSNRSTSDISPLWRSIRQSSRSLASLQYDAPSPPKTPRMQYACHTFNREQLIQPNPIPLPSTPILQLPIHHQRSLAACIWAPCQRDKRPSWIPGR